MADYPSQGDRGRGALFKIPEDQRRNDKWPTHRGDLTLPSGEKLRLSGWVREARDGSKFLSLSAEPFEQRQQHEPERQQDRRDQRPLEQPRDAYADAKAGGGRMPAGDSEIPFSPEVR